jgi:hypothetical protein
MSCASVIPWRVVRAQLFSNESSTTITDQILSDYQYTVTSVAGVLDC